MNQEKDGSKALFYDTYALYAISKGETNYSRFTKGYTIVTSLMNLYELYYTLLKEKEENLAEKFLNRLLENCAELNSLLIKEAAKFRLEEIKRKLSYVDCLGYIIAKSRNIKFLTGDPGFKGIPNVEFVE